MSSDFVDVILSLFPPGSLWTPSEAEKSVILWTETGQTLDYDFDDSSFSQTTLTDTQDSLWFFPEDVLTLDNSTGPFGLSFDGTYDVIDPTNVSAAGVGLATIDVRPAVGSDQTFTADITRTIKLPHLMRMLRGMAANHQTAYEFLTELAYIREPLLTPFLEDLEHEYGVVPDTSLTEAQRRTVLHGIVYAPRSTGAADYLQTQLVNAGFAVQVHPNNLSNNPAGFYGGVGGELITNNKLYERSILEAEKDQALWSYVFYIGGDATYDDSGRIVHVATALISDALKGAFRELVLKYKPVHSWCIAVINDSQSWFTFSGSDAMENSATKGFANETRTTGGFWYEDHGFPVFIEDDLTSELLLDDLSGDHLIDG